MLPSFRRSKRSSYKLNREPPGLCVDDEDYHSLSALVTVLGSKMQKLAVWSGEIVFVSWSGLP